MGYLETLKKDFGVEGCTIWRYADKYDIRFYMNGEYCRATPLRSEELDSEFEKAAQEKKITLFKKEIYGYLYMHKTCDDMIYVGQTTLDKPEKRWKTGYKSNLLFTVAIEYYGWDNIEHFILDRIPRNLGDNDDVLNKELYEAEDWFIHHYETLNPLYGFNRSDSHGNRFIWTDAEQVKFLNAWIDGELNGFLSYVMDRNDWRVLLDFENGRAVNPKDGAEIKRCRDLAKQISEALPIDWQ